MALGPNSCWRCSLGPGEAPSPSLSLPLLSLLLLLFYFQLNIQSKWFGILAECQMAAPQNLVRLLLAAEVRSHALRGIDFDGILRLLRSTQPRVVKRIMASLLCAISNEVSSYDSMMY